MQYQVPQFLGVEDKVFGPFTIKQFIYLAAGFASGYIALRFIPYIGWLVALALVAFGGALAFYKLNKRSFVFLLESAYLYAASPRLYIWKRDVSDPFSDDDSKSSSDSAANAAKNINKGSGKLSDMNWEVDTQHKQVSDKKTP